MATREKPPPRRGLERQLGKRHYFLVPPQMWPGDLRRRARRLAGSAPTDSDGEWANANVSEAAQARVRYCLDDLAETVARVNELAGEHHRLSSEAEWVSGELSIAEETYRTEEDRARGRLLDERDAAAVRAERAPTRDSERPTWSLARLLVVVVIFAGEFVLSRSAAQLFGLSGYTLDLFALGVTAGLFAGCQVVADLTKRLGGGRRVIAIVAAVTFLAVVVAAVNLALLRTAYTEALFTTTAGRPFSVDTAVLRAVGWVGVALLVVLMAVDYGSHHARPNWGHRAGQASAFATWWRTRRAVRRFEDDAFARARSERANRRSQSDALRQKVGLVDRELHRWVGDLVSRIEDVGWACRQQNDANATMRHHYAQEYNVAHVPWHKRLRARWRGNQLNPVVLPGSTLVPLDVEEALASARWLAAHAIDELQRLGIITVDFADGLRRRAGGEPADSRAEVMPGVAIGAEPSASQMRLNGVHA